MSLTAADTEADLQRLALRLARLFRIERAGRLAERPAATARRLIDRRAALIDALIAAQQRWHCAAAAAAAAAQAPALDQALADLGLEVGRCRPAVERRLRELTTELRRRRGAATPSGLRRSIGGQILGRS